MKKPLFFENSLEMVPKKGLPRKLSIFFFQKKRKRKENSRTPAVAKKGQRFYFSSVAMWNRDRFNVDSTTCNYALSEGLYYIREVFI